MFLRFAVAGDFRFGFIFSCVLILTLSCFLSACSTGQAKGEYRPLNNAQFLPVPNINVSIPSLSSCTYSEDDALALNADEPVIVIVHGCFSSSGRFRSLADVFAFHGQQTVCFDYDYRESLDESADKLLKALAALSGNMRASAMSVIGHSQGGLVARRSLTQAHKEAISLAQTQIDLTTISSPFGGIEASAHCGSKVLAWLSLGLVKPICQIITGSKYREIPPGSHFMENPGVLASEVKSYLKVVTDEKNTCRRYYGSGQCAEDDYVFSVDEQKQKTVDADARLESLLVKSGHVEIVGDELTAPKKLIAILQQKGILNATPPAMEKEFSLLLERLYEK